MKQKLIRKTLRPFLLLSIAILCVATPVFYFSLNALYKIEADEMLTVDKEEFIKNIAPTLKVADIVNWNKFNQDIKLVNSKQPLQDSFYTTNIFNEIEDENEPIRMLKSSVIIDGQNYHFTAKLNLVENSDLSVWIILLFLILMTVLLGGLYLLNRRITKTVWQPFYQTLDQLETFNINSKNTLDRNDNNIEEFSRLNESIEKWLNRNAHIYESQKEFIENASHELQTPLAVFKAKVESLTQLENIDERQYSLIDELNKAVDRLSRLNKNLLLFARIDNNQYLEAQDLNIKDSIAKDLDFYKEQASVKKIDLLLELVADATIKTNPFLFETMLKNLLSNAIRHNHNNGRILIKLTENKLIVSNTGNNIALDKDKLYKRFSNTNATTKGTGLGLAIVKRIVELNHWQIDYYFQDPLHTFTVSF